MNCKTCGHYELYKMITSGQPFGYTGDIPCRRCERYVKLNDEHTQEKYGGNHEIRS